MAHTYEKQTILELIRLYRANELLWNTSHELYSNKVARNKALDVLFVKFKDLSKDGNIMQMKKKIENLRTTYKRERSKVIKSQLNGDAMLYEPSLWYYKEMSFLDKLDDLSSNETSRQLLETSNNAEDDNDDDSFATSPRNKRKRTSVYLSDNDDEYVTDFKIQTHSPTPNMSKTIYLNEDDSAYQENKDNIFMNENEPSDSKELERPEMNLFGRTIGAQLNELRPKQRFIAEKLISEVIFYGRLEKLRTGTTINLQSDLM